MAIETSLRTLLLTQTSITSRAPARKVGNVTYQAIFNEQPAQGFKPPYVLIHLMGMDPYLVLGGTSGMRKTEFDIDCYGLTFEEANNLAAAVETFIDDYTGTVGSDRIDAVLLTSKRHDRVFLSDGTDTRQHIVSISIEVQHTAV